MPEGLLKNLESRQIFTSELNLIVGRMHEDIARPAQFARKAPNKFVELIATIDDGKERLGENYGAILMQGDRLGNLFIPEMIIIHRKRTNKPIPTSPDPFFEELHKAKDHQLRQAGVNSDHILRAEDYFKKASQSTNGQPVLWTSAQIMDVLMTALRLNNKDNLLKFQKRAGGTKLPDYMEKTLFLSYFLTQVAARYVHPDTVNNWVELIRDDHLFADSIGLEDPSDMLKFALEK